MEKPSIKSETCFFFLLGALITAEKPLPLFSDSKDKILPLANEVFCRMWFSFTNPALLSVREEKHCLHTYLVYKL